MRKPRTNLQASSSWLGGWVGRCCALGRERVQRAQAQVQICRRAAAGWLRGWLGRETVGCSSWYAAGQGMPGVCMRSRTSPTPAPPPHCDSWYRRSSRTCCCGTSTALPSSSSTPPTSTQRCAQGAPASQLWAHAAALLGLAAAAAMAGAPPYCPAGARHVRGQGVLPLSLSRLCPSPPRDLPGRRCAARTWTRWAARCWTCSAATGPPWSAWRWAPRRGACWQLPGLRSARHC